MISEALKQNYAYLFEPDLLEEIDAVAVYRKVRQGELLMDIGQPITHMPLLLGGAIKILREDEKGDELVLYYIEKGDTCTLTFSCCMDLIRILTIIAVTLFTLLGLFLLISKKGNKRANLLLGLFFLLWAVDFLDGVLLLKGFYLHYPNLALWGEPLILLYGPLLYDYTLALTSPKIKRGYTFFFHWIPFFMGVLALVLVYHGDDQLYRT